jgi:hypothetical protein
MQAVYYLVQQVPSGQFTSIKNIGAILDCEFTPVGRALRKSFTSTISLLTNMQLGKAPPGIPTYRALKSEREFFLAWRPESDLTLLAAEGIHSVRIGKQDRFFGTPWNGFTNLPNRLGYREWGIPVPWTFPPVVGPVSVPAPVPASAASTAVTIATATTVTVTASASVAAPSVPSAGAVDHGSFVASASGPGPVSVAAAADVPLFLFAPRTWLDDDSEDSDSCDEIASKATVAGKRKREDKDNQNAPTTKKHETV